MNFKWLFVPILPHPSCPSSPSCACTGTRQSHAHARIHLSDRCDWWGGTVVMATLSRVSQRVMSPWPDSPSEPSELGPLWSRLRIEQETEPLLLNMQRNMAQSLWGDWRAVKIYNLKYIWKCKISADLSQDQSATQLFFHKCSPWNPCIYEDCGIWSLW